VHDPDALELLAVSLMDLRATTESMRRSVTNAQSSIEQYRHTRAADRLADIADCLQQLRREATNVSTVTEHAERALQQLAGRTA
jgi:hypothetical protein